MIKWILILLIIPCVYADSIEFNSGTSDDLRLNEINSYSIATPIIAPTPSVEGGAGSSWSKSTAYYDIEIDNIKPTYEQGDIIELHIIIINKGDTPDRDAILRYYILDAENKKYLMSQEIFEEIRPTCEIGELDRYLGLCVVSGSSETYDPLYYKIIRKLPLQEDITLGEWKVVVEYETEQQPLIEVYKTFLIKKSIKLLLTIVIISMILIFAIYLPNRRS